MRKLITLTLIGALALAACTAGEETSQEREAESRQQGYDELVAAQPGETMTYSPTRETINFWIETWNEPGKTSYVYLLGANGQFIGYYVLEGLPVSYCAALSPTYELVDVHHDGDGAADFQVPAPANDGVYYSGGQCNQYYGRDATTGAFIEFSIGGSLNYLLFDQPLPVEADPLGFTTIEDMEDE